MAFVHVRHRSASGRLDEMWEYDPARRIIELVFRLASEHPSTASIPVCAPKAARRLAYPIVRIDGETWRIVAARFVESIVELRGNSVTRMLVPEPFPIHPRLTCGDHILLCAAPPNVDRELEAL